MPLEFLTEILLGAGAVVGALLLFVLNRMWNNQNRIFEWAQKETTVIEQKIERNYARIDTELRDIRQSIRHRQRDMWQVIIMLARAIPGGAGQEIADDIIKQMTKLDE